MFIPIEGEDCIWLAPVIAMIREGDSTRIYREDGTIQNTGFRPLTLVRRYAALDAEALHPKVPAKDKEGESQ